MPVTAPIDSSGHTPASPLTRLAPAAWALLRIGTGLLFMEHGLQKLFGMFGGIDGAGATVPLGSLFGVAGVLETVGGLLLLLGFLTRPVAFVLVVEMLVAFFKQHFPKGGAPIENGGELALLYMLVFLFFATHGAGPASVDGRKRG